MVRLLFYSKDRLSWMYYRVGVGRVEKNTSGAMWHYSWVSIYALYSFYWSISVGKWDSLVILIVLQATRSADNSSPGNYRG